MKQSIEKLGRNVFFPKEYAEVMQIARAYTRRKGRTREEKLACLQTLQKFFDLDNRIGILIPSHTHYPVEYRDIVRPIHYYCKEDIEIGIRHTRNFVFNACGHIEGCAKQALKKFDPRARTQIPLGAVVNQLKKFPISKEILQNLETLNKVIYVRAKHVWDPKPQLHLFKLDEAILIYFIIRKLAKTLVEECSIELKMN